jgi:hypothetical protein
MSIELLPPNFDKLLSDSVMSFWKTRGTGSSTQQGSRGNVISGKNMGGFLDVVTAVAAHCGLDEDCVFASGKANLTIPGYFRPCKNWDALVIYKKRLLAVFEFKSQVGSFGNNFNNRSEEVIGSAADLWEASLKEMYHPTNHKQAKGIETTNNDPRPPFLGYLMLLQDCEGSNCVVRADSRHYHVSPDFQNTSYAMRYRILCERLMERRLYGAASLILSDEVAGSKTGHWHSLSQSTEPKNLFAKFAAEIAAALA